MKGLSWGIIGPGAIADVFAQGLIEHEHGHVTRVLGQRRPRAEAFAARHGGEVVDSLDGMFDATAGGAPEAVYVATPHTLHGEFVARALVEHVPVLVEKPLTTRPAHTAALIEGAARHRVPLMEGWMYRGHPQASRTLELVRSGAIGELREIHAEFAFDCPLDPRHRLFDPELGGGAIWDVGGYPLSFTLGIARVTAEAGQDPLQEMELVEASGSVTSTGVDGDARCRLRFGSVEAHLACSIQRAGGSSARVVGSSGELVLREPWLVEGERRGLRGELELRTPEGIEHIEVASEQDCFALEAAELARMIAAGEVSPRFPYVDHDETLSIARLADEWQSRILGQRA